MVSVICREFGGINASYGCSLAVRSQPFVEVTFEESRVVDRLVGEKWRKIPRTQSSTNGLLRCFRWVNVPQLGPVELGSFTLRVQLC
ncbi:hypothetical protein Q1695_000043 [Nippostrongylus brasiliensis]|nr:hypothetical protein Q1695_000043 [Nippostrongylus brasiliensis]